MMALEMFLKEALKLALKSPLDAQGRTPRETLLACEISTFWTLANAISYKEIPVREEITLSANLIGVCPSLARYTHL